MQIADDFIENVISSSCDLAKHRHSDTLEVKDVQLHLDKAWNVWIPGFGSDDLKPYKRAPATEAHKQVSCLVLFILCFAFISLGYGIYADLGMSKEHRSCCRIAVKVILLRYI